MARADRGASDARFVDINANDASHEGAIVSPVPGAFAATKRKGDAAITASRVEHAQRTS